MQIILCQRLIMKVFIAVNHVNLLLGKFIQIPSWVNVDLLLTLLLPNFYRTLLAYTCCNIAYLLFNDSHFSLRLTLFVQRDSLWFYWSAVGTFRFWLFVSSGRRYWCDLINDDVEHTIATCLIFYHTLQCIFLLTGIVFCNHSHSHCIFNIRRFPQFHSLIIST